MSHGYEHKYTARCAQITHKHTQLTNDATKQIKVQQHAQKVKEPPAHREDGTLEDSAHLLKDAGLESSPQPGNTLKQCVIHLLFSRLAIGRDDSSFTFGVHAGVCFKTFTLLNTCQRKQPGKRSISIATPLVFLLPPPFFTSPTLATNQAQFLLGGLETVRCWFFFFFSAAVPEMCSTSLRCATAGAS